MCPGALRIPAQHHRRVPCQRLREEVDPTARGSRGGRGPVCPGVLHIVVAGRGGRCATRRALRPALHGRDGPAGAAVCEPRVGPTRPTHPPIHSPPGSGFSVFLPFSTVPTMARGAVASGSATPPPTPQAQRQPCSHSSLTFRPRRLVHPCLPSPPSVPRQVSGPDVQSIGRCWRAPDVWDRGRLRRAVGCRVQISILNLSQYFGHFSPISQLYTALHTAV